MRERVIGVRMADSLASRCSNRVEEFCVVVGGVRCLLLRRGIRHGVSLLQVHHWHTMQHGTAKRAGEAASERLAA